jgi:hypothetical protein
MNPDPLSESTPKETIGVEHLSKLSKEPELPKIRGALILVAASLIFSLLQNLAYFLGAIGPVVRSPLWERYTNPSSSMFHSQWKLALICDAVTAILILFWNVAMLVLFFRKKRVFPMLAAASLPIIFLLILRGHYLWGDYPSRRRKRGICQGRSNTNLALYPFIYMDAISSVVEKSRENIRALSLTASAVWPGVTSAA